MINPCVHIGLLPAQFILADFSWYTLLDLVSHKKYFFNYLQKIPLIFILHLQACKYYNSELNVVQFKFDDYAGDYRLLPR